jgi:surfeit locus 1 family protein
VVVVVATLVLGNWQSRRADYRGAQQDALERMQQAGPLTLRSAADAVPAERYRAAVAEGEYDAARQIWLDNRTYRGVAGFYVLSPLKLDDGTCLLVNRGWIAATARHEAPPAPPPAGRVRVVGRLNQPPPSFIELKHVVPTGPVWENLSIDAYARSTGWTVAPLVLEQDPGTADGLVRDWPPPESGRDKNISYMWQWYGFAGLTVVLWLVLNWRRSAPTPDESSAHGDPTR